MVAIGNPYGLGGTVTAGIISAEGRDIGDGPYDSFLQIDAPINKGNSGGPAFNLQGQVVGVNTAIYSPSGGSVGIGFAIPASTVDSVVGSLEHDGVVSRGYLGVLIQPISQDIADGLGLKAANGALVDKTEPGTPAAAAGLKSGDVITELNGQSIKDAADLTRRVAALKPGDKAELSFMRDGEEKTVSLTLAAQKNDETASAESSQGESAPALLGVQLAPAKEVAGAGDEGVGDRQRRSQRGGGEQGSHGRRRHSRSLRQSGVPAERREGRHRGRSARKPEGGADEDQDGGWLALRGVRTPESLTRERCDASRRREIAPCMASGGRQAGEAPACRTRPPDNRQPRSPARRNRVAARRMTRAARTAMSSNSPNFVHYGI